MKSDTTDGARGHHWVSFHDAGGHQVVETKRPNYEIGNACYFGNGIPSGWQLRPALSSDGWVNPPKNAIILLRKIGKTTIYRSITLPPHRRKNTPSNVKRAYLDFLRLEPGLAAFEKSLEQIEAKLSNEKK